MDKYLKVEKELASLLGVFDMWEDETYSFNGSMKWARKNEDAFKLLLRYSLEINYITSEATQSEESNSYRPKQLIQIRKYIKDNSKYGNSPLVISENIDQHEDIFSAVRYAVVCAVIVILKENRMKTI
jgi:hypothetical protein